jgi:hypothetical protein
LSSLVKTKPKVYFKGGCNNLKNPVYRGNIDILENEEFVVYLVLQYFCDGNEEI